MTSKEAIGNAERLLPGSRVPEGEPDTRWQAVASLHTFIATDPDDVWGFIDRWARSHDADLRMAVATCLLEHLLEQHFARFFPRVERAVRSDARFADTFSHCWDFGHTRTPQNKDRFEKLKAEAASITRAHRLGR